MKVIFRFLKKSFLLDQDTFFDWGKKDCTIQKELARTHTKNATKPNPLGIIPLQPTRKENNWETKEATERAAVTLETERVKWPNLWMFMMTMMTVQNKFGPRV